SLESTQIRRQLEAENSTLPLSAEVCRRRAGITPHAAVRSDKIKQRSEPGAQGSDQQIRIARFVQSRHRTEAIRQVREAVATQEQERVATHEQVVGQRLDHRAVQIDIENRKVEFLV